MPENAITRSCRLKLSGPEFAEPDAGTTEANMDPTLTKENEMKQENTTWNRIEGNWKEFKGKAQQRWGKLTSDDLDVIAGKRKELEGRLQKAYGYTHDKVKTEVDDFCKSGK